MARELGVVEDIYRVGENEVYVVRGEPFGTFDLPAVRAFIRIFAPRRGEIVVDADALDLQPPKREADRPANGRARHRRRATRRPRPPEGVRVTLEIDVLTLFPSMVSGPLSESIPGRILERGVATIRVHDLREFGLGRHRSVDDTPYGGGAGMVMRVEPVVAAIESVRRPESLVILLDPGGEVFSQTRAIRPRDPRAPRLRLSALRGRRRTDPRVRRPRAVDRRLRA